jgi:hypothetical protein
VTVPALNRRHTLTHNNFNTIAVVVVVIISIRVAFVVPRAENFPPQQIRSDRCRHRKQLLFPPPLATAAALATFHLTAAAALATAAAAALALATAAAWLFSFLTDSNFFFFFMFTTLLILCNFVFNLTCHHTLSGAT